MGSGSNDRRVSKAGKPARSRRKKANRPCLASEDSDLFDANGKLREIRRVNFYTYDEEGKNETLYGCIIEEEGKRVAMPADDPVLQKILSEPLELSGEIIPPSETERFLQNLHLRYTAHDLAASRMFLQHPGIKDVDGHISDWDKPSAADEWKREREFEEYLAQLELEDEEEGEDIIINLPPIPDWQRKPPRRRNREQPGLFDGV